MSLYGSRIIENSKPNALNNQVCEVAKIKAKKKYQKNRHHKKLRTKGAQYTTDGKLICI